MKKRSLKNLTLNKQSISNFSSKINGGANLGSDSKTGGCNTVSMILMCPAPEPEPVPYSQPPMLCPSGETDSAVYTLLCTIG